jgi:type IV pilus assembly protein PilB
VFQVLALAISCVAASSIARDLMFDGATMTSVRPAMIAWVVALVLLFIMPLCVFARPLQALRQRSLFAYSALATHHDLAFEDRWLQQSGSPRGGQVIPSPADLGARFAAVQSMRTIPVNKAAGTTFASVLRSVLRQDPNVIMVGEVRDAEVAQIVGQAAYTGHLVLTSVHTIDAAAAVGRLLNLGLEPFRVSEILNAVFAQRLLRRLCPHCRVLHDEIEARRLGQSNGITAVPALAGPGCEHCRNSGYTGRFPVAEALVPDEAMRRLIRDAGSAADIKAAMRAGGYRSMREVALDLVEQGLTSIEEVNRVLADDEVVRVEQARARQKVLVVDDDRMIRMLVKLLLEKEGYDVIEGENGHHAVELSRHERPDLLFLDLMMPQMDGFQALDRLRRDLTLANLPVIVLTAESGPDTERRVLELGADDYLIKPFEPGVLLSRVRAVFRRAGRSAA